MGDDRICVVVVLGKEQQNGYEHYTTFLRRPAFRKPRKKEVVFSLYQGLLLLPASRDEEENQSRFSFCSITTTISERFYSCDERRRKIHFGNITTYYFSDELGRRRRCFARLLKLHHKRKFTHLSCKCVTWISLSVRASKKPKLFCFKVGEKGAFF